jgi:hypothetical protein
MWNGRVEYDDDGDDDDDDDDDKEESISKKWSSLTHTPLWISFANRIK